MACPYFIPTEPHERELWAHRQRLPLGNGFAGRCGAGEVESACDDETLRMHCNLGYSGCARLPDKGCEWDAVRFSVLRESATVLRVQFACETAHRPAMAGELRYDLELQRWVVAPDARLVKLAGAAMRAFVARPEQAWDEISFVTK